MELGLGIDPLLGMGPGLDMGLGPDIELGPSRLSWLDMLPPLPSRLRTLAMGFTPPPAAKPPKPPPPTPLLSGS